MTTTTDLAALEAAEGSVTTLLGTAAAAAATAEGQVAKGTPSSWASIATMFDIANAQTAQKSVATITAQLGVDVAPPPVVVTPPAGVPALGSYNGAGAVAQNDAFATEVGLAAPAIYSDYLDGSSWSAMVGTATSMPLLDLPRHGYRSAGPKTEAEKAAEPWVLTQLQGKLGAQRLVLSVPLVTAGYSGPQAALAAYAAGGPAMWDNYFATLGLNLVAAGFGNAIIRLMWEPDSGIYSSGDLVSAANFAALWKRAVTAMRSVTGQAFAFDWYWGGNFDAKTNATAYPGSSFVDHVTFDFYDQSWDGSTGAPPYNGTPFTAAQEQYLWTHDYNGLLANLAAFAKAQGKPISIGEWGIITRSDNHGGGDDPTFATMFGAWMVANQVAWASYFNFNSGGDSILSTCPNSLAAVRAWVASLKLAA